jgi:group I intron endonuclease
MYVYLVRNELTGSVYVGITRSSLKVRWKSHKSSSKRGKKLKLYDAMRKYGFENFSISILKTCESEDDLLASEKYYVKYYRDLLGDTYNILDGGESYFPINDVSDWKNKLKKARVGKTPAKGMKHSLENRELFSKVSKDYWNSQETYNSEEIVKLTFKEANTKYSISKTHYYRLKKSMNIPNTKRSYNAEDILKYSCKDAVSKFGISRRHYVYLKNKHRKQAGNNESC